MKWLDQIWPASAGEKAQKAPQGCPLPASAARIIIENVSPRIDGGAFPVKRIVGERVTVRADVFADGHDEVRADLLYRQSNEASWRVIAMNDLGNDAWEASFIVNSRQDHLYTVRGRICEFSCWCHDLKKKADAGTDVAVDLRIGSALVKSAAGRATGPAAKKMLSWSEELAAPKDKAAALKLALSDEFYTTVAGYPDLTRSVVHPGELRVVVDRERAAFSSWYEFFPRSWGAKPGVHGTFKECANILPEIARMGFDVVYLPPIHPIGKAFRKGRNNATRATDDDPGSPWAIGSAEGGHKSIDPRLGTMGDFTAFVKKARELGIEVALDIAFQCSPDHPYLKEHPAWFKWRPDGTVQYAENPPKKYEDIVPFNYDTTDRQALWDELKSIFLFWAGKGVTIFRVDNPHTKPFLFWDWVIAEVKKEYPDAIFLAEAFTRPKIMYRLAKGGFTQSYTYFTWRSTKQEFQEYLTELTQTDVAEFFRPNFWPNTPDILAGHLQGAERNVFIIRAFLAATLSSNFGVYGPAFELCVNTPLPGKEEYIDSEKYEIKAWNWEKPGHIKDVLAALNKARRQDPALQATRNIRFCEINNDQLLAYVKTSQDGSNIIVVIVNLDVHRKQGGMLTIPLQEIGLQNDRRYTAQDVLSGEKFAWHGPRNHIELSPDKAVAHIIRITAA